MPEPDTDRLVQCVKLKEELPGLKRQPFPTDFGRYLFDNVSAQAWDDWLKESVRYINTYRVDLSSKEGTEFMLKQLKIWLEIEEGELAQTAWVPEADSATPETPEEDES